MYHHLKHITVSIYLSLVAICALGQSYSTPESIEYYPADNSYFVANASAGEIVKLTAANTLENFVSDLPSGPHGLELVGDTLYACTGGSVHALNATTGAVLFEIPIGGSFLNGITHVGNQLFITDFSAKKIITYRIATNTFNTFVSDLVKTPNGIIYDSIDNKLVLVNWGGSAPIHAINLTDSTVTELTATSLNNCDGIAMDCEGNFYVSSWSPQRISIFDHNFSAEPLTADITGLSNAADIYYNRHQDTLVIPNSGNDKVLKAYFESCTDVETPVAILVHSAMSASIYPNPVNTMLYVELPNYSGEYTFQLFNALGQMIALPSLQQNSFNVGYLNTGCYLLHIKKGNEHFTVERFVKE